MRRLAGLWLALFAATPAQLPSQSPSAASARLAFTSASQVGRDAIASAWDDFAHGYVRRAYLRARIALSVDPGNGFARVLVAHLGTDMSTGERQDELDRGVADAARGSGGELAVAMALRAAALDRTAEVTPLVEAAAALLSDDPSVALLRVTLAPGSLDERVAALREVTRRFPAFAPAFNHLARSQLSAGDTSAGLRAVEEYVRLAPEYPGSHGAYGDILLASGRVGEAHSHYRRAVEIEPAYAPGHAGIAAVNAAMKQYPDAITIMRRALALDPTMMSGYNLIAQAYLLLGDPAQARSAFLQSGERAPTAAIRVTQQGYAALTFIMAGNPKEAVQSLSDVALSAEDQNLGQQAAAMHRQMALIEATLGERRLVAGHLTRAAQFAPPAGSASVPGPALRFAALCYALTGQMDQARTAARQFGEIATAGTATQRHYWHEVNAVIAIAERNLERARAELADGGPAPLGRALFAEALRNTGRTVEARALGDELLNRPLGPTVFDVIARFKMQRM